jgi:glycosyltransferase involved in cell wall biosynthesis
MKLSVCLATYNEESNISECLESIKELADEIVIVDGSSTDSTVLLSQKYTDNILVTDNPLIFHINKQKAIDRAKGEWILLLDADERVGAKLASEIREVIKMKNSEIEEYQKKLKDKDLFLRHQNILEKRDGVIGDKNGEYCAFFIPRVNFFLGKYLKYGGVYPDGVIRLFKKGAAYLPCKDVHEQMVVKGRVGWLGNELLHRDSPTFERYIKRNSRYIDLMVREFENEALPKSVGNFLGYCIIKPVSWFFITQVRHKGFLDGLQGIIFSFFSALRFPRAYLRYISKA